MQTRKNRKNEESSYESMLKLRRDLTKVVTLLEMVKRREKTKKEKLNLTLDIFDKRYALNDFNGHILEFANSAVARQRLNNSLNVQQWISKLTPQPRRTYKVVLEKILFEILLVEELVGWFESSITVFAYLTRCNEDLGFIYIQD